MRVEGTPIQAIERVWSMNRTRRHLSPSQAAIADAKRNKMLEVYALVRQAAAERQAQAPGKPRGKKKSDMQEIAQEKPEDRKTRTRRAKAAGTNAKYINLADKLVEERPDLAVFDIRDVVTWDAAGNVYFKPSDQINKERGCGDQDDQEDGQDDSPG